MTTDPTITIAGLRATIEREYYREQARTMAGEIVELQAERRGHAAERQSLTAERDALAAQLAEVRAELDRAPKVCAIHGVSLAVEADAFNRIDTERADAVSELARTCRDLASERANLAACQAQIARLEQAANERSAEVARLTARVAELEAAGRAIKITPTLLAAALVGSRDGSVTPAAAAQAEHLLSLAGELFIAPPTSPPAARPVFAGVSLGDLEGAFFAAELACPATAAAIHLGCCRLAGLRAVLARLEVSLVAPVDPEAVALRLRDHAREIGLHPQREPADYLDSLARLVRVIFRAAGIPVTPERGK